MGIIAELFTHDFIVRSLVVGVLVSLCAALLGVSLVLKRYSMIGDGLSNVGFGALAISMALGVAPLYFSIPLVMLAAILLLRLSQNSRIKGDAAIALVSSSSLAIGALVISATTGLTLDVCNYMFGSVLTMRKSDVYLSVAVTLVVLILYILFYNRIFAVTFDETFAQASGTSAGRYNLLLAILTSLVIVVGMRMMGAMLISSLVIFPALTAMRVFHGFRSVIVASVILSVTCFVVGIIFSYTLSVVLEKSIPTGASVVAVNLILFLLFSLIGFYRRTFA